MFFFFLIRKVAHATKMMIHTFLQQKRAEKTSMKQVSNKQQVGKIATILTRSLFLTTILPCACAADVAGIVYTLLYKSKSLVCFLDIKLSCMCIWVRNAKKKYFWSLSNSLSYTLLFLSTTTFTLSPASALVDEEKWAIIIIIMTKMMMTIWYLYI